MSEISDQLPALILSLTPEDGSSIGNVSLLALLRERLPGLSDQDYAAARDSLIDQGLLARGRGIFCCLQSRNVAPRATRPRARPWRGRPSRRHRPRPHRRRNHRKNHPKTPPIQKARRSAQLPPRQQTPQQPRYRPSQPHHTKYAATKSCE